MISALQILVLQLASHRFHDYMQTTLTLNIFFYLFTIRYIKSFLKISLDIEELQELQEQKWIQI
jgi:hypothetical protein